MTFMDIYVNVFFDFFLQKSLAGTLPATLAPFADRFTRQTADLANACMRPFSAMMGHMNSFEQSLFLKRSVNVKKC